MSARKYFVYELKKALPAIGSIALIMTAIMVTAVLSSRFGGDYDYVRPESGIEAISFMGGLLAAVVPIWMFAYKMKKRSADLYYALPLKRGQVLSAKYLLGLVAVYAPFTLAFWLGTLAAVIKYPSDAIAGEYYFAAYFAALPAIFCIYAIACFAFTRANRLIDGMAFIIFWMVALYAVAGGISRFTFGIWGYLYSPIAPLNTISEYLSQLIETKSLSGIVYIKEYNINMAIGFTLTGLQAIAATVLLFITERKFKAENIGGVSDSPFGYKVMIPLLTVGLILGINLIGTAYEIYMVVIIASAAFMLTALYKHTFKIGKIQAIIFASSVVLGVVLSIVASYVYSAINGIPMPLV